MSFQLAGGSVGVGQNDEAVSFVGNLADGFGKIDGVDVDDVSGSDCEYVLESEGGSHDADFVVGTAGDGEAAFGGEGLGLAFDKVGGRGVGNDNAVFFVKSGNDVGVADGKFVGLSGEGRGESGQSSKD